MNNKIHYEKSTEISVNRDKTLLNCKKFLSDKIKKINTERPYKKLIKQKIISLSKIYLNNKYNKNIIKKDTHKSNFNRTFIFKSKYRKNYKDDFNNKVPIKKLFIRKINSAKTRVHSNINTDKYMQYTKVKEIIDDLLSEKEENKNLTNLLIVRRDLKKIINPNKSLDITLRKNPESISGFKSYKNQIKYYMGKKNQKAIINGIHDYHQNIKHYNDIYFNSFIVNDKSSKKNSNKNFFNKSACNIKSNFNILKGYDKFKNDYIKSYEEKFYFTNNKSKRNDNFQNMDEYEFNKMMPFDQNMDNIYLSAKQTFINIKKNSFENIKFIFS